MSAPVFLVAPQLLAAAVPGGPLRLDGPEGRHAVAVRRLAVGEELELADGAGRAAACTVAAVEGRDVLHVTVRSVRDEPPPQPRLVVVQALPKGDRGELAVEAMTEVGVDVVVPWAATRCVTRWRDARGERALARWRSTAREAAKQARRARVPEVPALAGTADVLALVRSARLALVLHEGATAPLAAVTPPPAGDVVVVVGPEGGLAPEELEALTAAGGQLVRLGPTVLRTSTAGVAALSVLLSRTSRWA